MPHAKLQRLRERISCTTFAAARLRVGVLFLTIAGSYSPPVSFAQQRADFILIEKPQRLTVLNQYQQKLSSEEHSALFPFSPFKIINPDETLGDGLTQCMKVEANGAALYLVKDDSGEIAGATGVKRYRNVVVLSDTIMIVKRNAVELFDAGGKKRTPLANGTRLRRMFQSSRLVFVQLLSTGTYGWANVRDGQGKNWTVVRRRSAVSSKSLDQLLPEIQLKLNAVNGKLTKLYDIWNRKASVYRVAPQWMLELSNDLLLATLSGDSLAQFYRESTRWLSKDIESLLLGTPMRVTASPGRLEIR